MYLSSCGQGLCRTGDEDRGVLLDSLNKNQHRGVATAETHLLLHWHHLLLHIPAGASYCYRYYYRILVLRLVLVVVIFI